MLHYYYMVVPSKVIWGMAVFYGSVLFLFFPLFVGAQSLGGISLTSVPKYPEPGEEVSVSLDQYGVNTFGATIRWYINGTEEVSARNERSVTFVSGNLGEKTTVRVSVAQASGVSLTSTKTIAPAIVDMILEADTYVPYFYKGRALPSSNAGVRVVALVHGGTGADRSTYSYKWQLGTSVLFGGAVRGKYVAELVMPQFDRKPLTVEVSDSGGNVVAKNSIILVNQDPELLFYEENALRGHLGRAIMGELPLLGEETTVFGEPYYLSKNVLGSGANFSWKINNRLTTPNTTPNSLTLQKSGSGGTVGVELDVVVEGDVPQRVKDSFLLTF